MVNEDEDPIHSKTLNLLSPLMKRRRRRSMLTRMTPPTMKMQMINDGEWSVAVDEDEISVESEDDQARTAKLTSVSTAVATTRRWIL